MLKPRSWVAGWIGLLTMAACASAPDVSVPPPPSPQADASYPHTVRHVFGNTEVREQPQRVGAFGATDHDTLIALGVVPVMAPLQTCCGRNDGATPWFAGAMERLAAEHSDHIPSVPRYESHNSWNLAALADAQPDLLTGLDTVLTKAEYAELTAIAPTVVYPVAGWEVTWQESVRTLGGVVGVPERAEQLVGDTSEKLARLRRQYPEQQGAKVAWVWFAQYPGQSAPQVGVYTAHDPRVRALADAGFTSPQGLKRVPVVSNAPAANLDTTSAAGLDADVIVADVPDGAAFDELLASPVAQAIPAVSRGAVVPITDEALQVAALGPSVLSTPVLVDGLLQAINQTCQSADCEAD